MTSYAIECYELPFLWYLILMLDVFMPYLGIKLMERVFLLSIMTTYLNRTRTRTMLYTHL